ncbi:MAG: methyl-accepting chemotaxis protein [Woeseiaceae bacterium]
MANKTDTSTIFRIVGMLAAVLLLAAAALVYLKGGGGSSSAELAALSQAVPSQAASAVRGTSGAYDELSASVTRLAELRRSTGSSAPGSSAEWKALMSAASAILTGREDAEALLAATSIVADRADAVVQMSDGLLDRSGSTAIMQQFQQRADNARQLATTIAQSPNSGDATAMVDDVAFLRAVANGLAGENSQFDIRPLNAEARETTLVPIQSDLAELEAQTEIIVARLPQVISLGAPLAELQTTSASLGRAFVGAGSTGSLPGFLQNPWIPIACIVLALLLVLGMLLLNNKSATFERVAKEQAEQNERNQQAILRLLDEMGSLADGDLTVEATVTEDITGTIADSFNYAIEELRKLVATVNETAIMVDSAAKQTESTATNMAKAADNQAREINAATESIVSMAASIEEVSGNAERSSDVARHSVEVAHKGGEAVRRTIDGMNAIRETIQDTSKRIKRLGESSQEIGNIVELINDIAEQTNILALNASIQASMAGEAGRGFAVVADEVQRLAERSTNATKQIEVLVRTIQADTNEAVVSMERSTTDVVGGALLAENAGAALDEIEQVSNQIASLVQNISGSARQQAGSAADVTRRTTRLREISEQTGKATTATAAAISKLSELASQLRKTVAGFSLPNKSLKTSALAATSASVPANQEAGEQAKAG